MTYELTFEGAARAKYFPRYRRNHKTLESAREEARRVLDRLETMPQRYGMTGLEPRGLNACHSPMIYGPGGQVASLTFDHAE